MCFFILRLKGFFTDKFEKFVTLHTIMSQSLCFFVILQIFRFQYMYTPQARKFSLLVENMRFSTT